MQERSFNYLFFGAFLCALMGLQIYHGLAMGVSHLMMVSCVLQGCLEFLALGMIAVFLKKRVHKSLYYSYIGFVFLLFIAHVIDVILVQYMHLSIWRALSMVAEESLANFVEKICMIAPLGVWIALIPLAIALPMLGVALYLATRRFATCHKQFMTWLGVVPILIIGIDLACVKSIHPEAIHKFQKILPFKQTVLKPQFPEMAIRGALQVPENESQIALTAPKLPNIYFFVAESIRSDYFNQDIAPNLFQLGNESNYIPKMIAGANCTQDAWYALFHSTNALTFGSYSRTGTEGALPLRVFKKMGYQIHCHSATEINYFDMGRVLFGEDKKLLTSCNVFPHRPPTATWTSDEKAFRSLHATHKSSGQLHIIFLDSTHFYYSWNPKFSAPFMPCAKEYGKHLTSRDPKSIALLKNRYKNSIAYVDHLIGQFIDHLKAEGLYDDAVIAFHADHGEEFYEKGNLFHASNLHTMQCEVPSVIKLGKTKLFNLPRVASQLDVMPTLIEYISKKPCDYFEGQSLFKPNYQLRAICARDNFSQNPVEFAVYGPKGRIIAKLEKSKIKIVSSTSDLKANDLLAQALPSLRIQPLRAKPHMDRGGVLAAGQSLPAPR